MPMGKKKTHEQYVQELQDRGRIVEPVEEYKGATIKSLHRCPCGNVWSVRPDQVLNKGVKCSKCADTWAGRRNTHEDYERELLENKIGVVPLEECTHRHKKYLHRCTCGNEWRCAPTNVLRGTRCGCVRGGLYDDEKYLELLKEKNIGAMPLEPYKGSNERILHRCECGNTWRATPTLVLGGHLCGCRGTSKPVSHERYLRKLKSKRIGAVPAEPYVKAHVKILHRCICGNIWAIEPAKLLKSDTTCGCRREQSNIARRLSDEKYLSRLAENGITDYVPVEPYADTRTPIQHKCVHCDNIFLATPHRILEKSQYFCCDEHRLYLQKLDARITKTRPLEQYKGIETKILHQCGECGNEWIVSPHSVLNHNGSCGCLHRGKDMHTDEQYHEKLKERYIGVVPLEMYRGADIKILHLCTCGVKWMVHPSNVLSGRKCGCVKSTGEDLIAAYLEKKEINYTRQYIFPDLRGESGRKPLKLDFAIYSGNRILCLVEFHGRQHFEFQPHFQRTMEKFENQKRRDQRVRDYAKAKSIPLIEITYMDEDPLGVLIDELAALGIGKKGKGRIKYEQLALF